MPCQVGRSSRKEVKDSYIQTCEMAKRPETEWALSANEVSDPPETMLSQLGRNGKNGMFDNIHHSATKR